MVTAVGFSNATHDKPSCLLGALQGCALGDSQCTREIKKNTLVERTQGCTSGGVFNWSLYLYMCLWAFIRMQTGDLEAALSSCMWPNNSKNRNQSKQSVFYYKYSRHMIVDYDDIAAGPGPFSTNIYVYHYSVASIPALVLLTLRISRHNQIIK